MERSDLYGLPLEEFTPARNALAKELRAEKRRDEAAEVAKLRKPSVAAWAVNQLVRTQKRELRALFEAGDALQQAQADLLDRRGEPADLRRASDAERDAVEALVEKARGLLDSAGSELTPAMLDRVTESLHAAALDAEGREAVSAGCLERELQRTGLGSAGEPQRESRRRKAAPKPGKQRPAKSEEPRSAKSEPRRAKSEPRTAKLKAARTSETEARRRAEGAVRQLESARERRDQAAEALKAAEAAVAAAREAAASASRSLRDAERAVKRLAR